tara:strand:- start:36485 stop:36604 length:120 start_codon:yes stop_codon:yes gene_type:complete
LTWIETDVMTGLKPPLRCPMDIRLWVWPPTLKMALTGYL